MVLVGGAASASGAVDVGAAASSEVGGALLHVELRETVPAASSEVDRAPVHVVLRFTGTVRVDLSRIEVTGPDGRYVAAGEVEYPDPDTRDELQALLPPDLGPGRYDVDWRTAAVDGHVVQGTFWFEIRDRAPGAADTLPGEAVPPGAEADPARPDDPAARPGERDSVVPGQDLVPRGTGTRWLQLLGTILLLGVAGSRYGLLPLLKPHEDLVDLGHRLRSGYWRAGWLAAVLLLLTLPARLYVEFWGAGPAWTGGEILDRLFTTAWGAGWFLHLAVVVLAGLGLVLAGSRGENPRGWSVFGLAALLVPAVHVLQGHAWGAESLRAVAVIAHYLHVAAVGIWLGGLVLLVVVGLGAVRAHRKQRASLEGDLSPAEEGTTPPLARLVNAFSRMALPSVVLFVAAGATLSWVHLGGSVQVLVGTRYGQTLLLKLALVAGALALGFYNWRRVRPGLAERPDAGTLRIPASVEAVLALLALLVTAALVALPLPG